MTSPLPIEAGPAGLSLRIRVTPGARRSEVVGLHGDAAGGQALAVRVTAPPEKGRATTAAIETLARALGLAPSRLSLKCGGRSRTKIIAVSGDGAEVRTALERLLSGEKDGW